MQRVNFERCGNLADVAVKLLAEKCQSLQSVSFKWCDKLASTSRRSTGAYRA